jgi:hypothetical protein
MTSLLKLPDQLVVSALSYAGVMRSLVTKQNHLLSLLMFKALLKANRA